MLFALRGKMAVKLDVDYYLARAEQERILAAGAPHPAAACVHEELARLYEDAVKIGARTSTAMSSAR